ncbi:MULTISPECIES: hypothetical protein [Acetobacter]|uniref:Uncharacterized protein n=1 Tax=Acetobacter cerevisiae TaxID=178900 RepID=A0A149UYL0_9PROT|nr:MULTISPECIES: hypothetical protein [Acetobacter]KXU93439.1 hypothetical protein AD928_08630 [Acetobacter cerevisiae]KXV72974.1 hypothetical protein AD952_02525 [Acetobacter cerevisiae]KXV79004.1 hypothetical protein AD954_00110 [Acetobacter cerevisiae]MCP1245237.1 hypothetical protein [Acetobacter cerevisiae]MCP1254813.1 hypothetical protein [Acetobacter cerevisiae]
MNLGERITRVDSWLLDDLCQPLADRLPERMPALEVGMSCQLGSLLFSAVSIIAVFVIGGMEDITNMMFNVLVWGLCVTFFIGLNRMRVLVQPGRPNPLRYMLVGVRLVSIPFTAYVLYQAYDAPAPFQLPMWFNALSNLVFVVGLYFISCQPRPPQRRAREDIWARTPLQEAGNS